MHIMANECADAYHMALLGFRLALIKAFQGTESGKRNTLSVKKQADCL